MGNLFFFTNLFSPSSQCAKLFPSTSVKPVSKLVTPAGSSSASSTVSSLTVKCHPINPSVVVTMLSTPSSPRLVPVSTSPDASSSILSPPLSMRSGPEPTDNSSTPSNLSLVKKMPPTTSPVVTTPLVRKSLISASTELESSLISALVSKASLSSTPSVEELDPVSAPSSSRDSPSITVRNPSSVSPSILPLRFPPPLLSPTTPSSLPTLSSSTLMSPSCSTMRPFTISAEETSISRDPPTPT